MNQRFTIVASTALLIILSGCDGLGNAATTPAETNAAFEAFVKATTRKSAAELPADGLKEAINSYVGMRVAAEAGVKAGLDKDPEVRSQIVADPRQRTQRIAASALPEGPPGHRR